MRRAVATLLAGGALLVPAGSTAAAAKPWSPHVRRAIAYAQTRAGTVRFSVRARHRAWGWRATLSAPSASVLKAMLLVAYLDDARVRGRALTAADRRLLVPMIRWSDNTAASSVLAYVGPDAVRALARRARMRRFVLDPVVWGDSLIDADDQTRFFRFVDRRVVARHRASAMHLLATVVPSQRWGIGQVRLRGWALYFKGGWGSGSGAVEHQVALLRRGRRRIAAAVLITGSPSHAYATQTLQGVFARLLSGLAVRRRRAG
ncbi:MAG TPA: serine hydrolase [Conexibacter sp.]|nr:serine hydrolase [Conexibacter sp.]